MAARFNRHRPALCLDCGAPLSVRERRNAGALGAMVCTWHDNQRMRETFGEQAFWVSEPSDAEVTFALPDEEPQTVVIDAFDLFGGRLYDD